MADEKLAIDGGPKAKPTPYGTGRRFGLEEARELLEALDQNTLFYVHGNKVKTFVREFADLYGVNYAVATSSGTGAIHVALGAAGVSVGDEVITSPITDMGTLIGILYQNAVPVFADLEPYSYNMSPEAVAACVTDRTKAILVVHLAGNPADMDPIMEIARTHGLTVIEDCAQSALARYRGRYVGTIGDFGAFSTNDYKHISTGDGGVVLVNGDEATFHRTHMFADKNYNRFGETVRGTIPYLAPNYRMTELQGAVSYRPSASDGRKSGRESPKASPACLEFIRIRCARRTRAHTGSTCSALRKASWVVRGKISSPPSERKACRHRVDT